MGTLWFDFGAVLFLVAAMVLISRLQDVISSEDKDGYRYMSGGIALLAVVSLLNLHFNMGMLSGIPFLSDPLSFRLIAWIGIISGTILLASGISTWLPLSQTYRKYNRQRIHRLELIKKVGQLIKVESRLPAILSRTLEHMVSDYELSFGAVYLYSRARKEVTFVSSAGEAPLESASLWQIEFDTRLLDKPRDGGRLVDQDFMRNTPSDLRRPEIIQPILVDDKPAGFFLAWTKPDCEVDNDDRINLQVITDIIGRKIQLDRNGQLQEFRNSLEKDRCRLVQTMDRKASFREHVARLATFVGERMPADLISVTVLSNVQGNQRYSMGTNRTVLHEIGINADWIHGSCIGAGESLVIKDTLAGENSFADQLVANSGMKSVVCVPLTVTGVVEGVLTVASKESGSYAAREATVLEAIAPVMGELVVSDRYQRNLSAGRGRSAALRDTTINLSQTHGIHEMLQKAATAIFDELHPVMVRVSTFDAEGTFLTSRTMLRKHESDNITPAEGHMILSLMPWHRIVREKGRTVTIDQADTEKGMTEIEIAQAFMPGLSQALLVPIKVSDRVVAVISLADSRPADEMESLEGEREFVEAVAAALSVSILLDYRREAAVLHRDTPSRLTATDVPDGELRGQMKSALTGIFGSVELIKTSDRPERNLEHYLSIIDRSARRISDYFAEAEVK